MSAPLKRPSGLASRSEVMKTPRAKREGFLFTGETTKSGAHIKYTIRGPRQLDPESIAKPQSPLLWVPGFLGIKPAYGDPRDALAYALARPVATYRHDRTEEKLSHRLAPRKLLHPGDLGGQSAVAMIDVLYERFEGQKVTLVGHSMGGPNAVEAALRRKNKVDQVVLVGSGGLEEGQNMVRLGRRMPGIFLEEVLPSLSDLAASGSLKMAFEAVRYVVENPWRTAGEALNIANRPLMKREIKELQKADIGVHAMQLEYDHFFPTELARQHAEPLVDSFTVVDGLDHLGPQKHPEVVATHLARIIAPQTFTTVSA